MSLYQPIPRDLRFKEFLIAFDERITLLDLQLKIQPETVADKTDYEQWESVVREVLEDIDSHESQVNKIISVEALEPQRTDLVKQARESLKAVQATLHHLNSSQDDVLNPELPDSPAASTSPNTTTTKPSRKRSHAAMAKESLEVPAKVAQSAPRTSKKPRMSSARPRSESSDDDESDRDDPAEASADGPGDDEKGKPKEKKYAEYGPDGRVLGHPFIPDGVDDPHKPTFACLGKCPHAGVEPPQYPYQREADRLWRGALACNHCASSPKPKACIGPGCNACSNCTLAKTQCSHSSRSRSAAKSASKKPEKPKPAKPAKPTKPVPTSASTSTLSLVKNARTTRSSVKQKGAADNSLPERTGTPQPSHIVPPQPLRMSKSPLPTQQSSSTSTVETSQHTESGQLEPEASNADLAPSHPTLTNAAVPKVSHWYSIIIKKLLSNNKPTLQDVSSESSTLPTTPPDVSHPAPYSFPCTISFLGSTPSHSA
ncbi:hypothetical protein ONZ45_g19476 [Pleurotus djamor]|nr:hypothetical protein ONZ45_g19476 [Pleurotus djamor]